MSGSGEPRVRPNLSTSNKHFWQTTYSCAVSIYLDKISRVLNPYVRFYRLPHFIHSHFWCWSLNICSTNIVFASVLIVRFPGHQQPTHNDCVTWLIFQIVSCNTMLLILELILRFVSHLTSRSITITDLYLSIRGLPFVAPLSHSLISSIRHQCLLCMNKVGKWACFCQ